MAKIRSIKPDFWTDGTIIRLPMDARLFYIGMWNFVCDRGHIEDDPLGLKLKILPADPVDGESLIQTLVDAGRVERFEVEGRPFLCIPRFGDHQRIESRWKSRCPACSLQDSQSLAEPRASLGEPLRASQNLSVGGEGRGGERKVIGGEVASDEPPAPKCKKHPHWKHDGNCRTCGDDRIAFEAWQAAESKKSKPHVHRWMPDGTCMTCDEVNDDETC